MGQECGLNPRHEVRAAEPESTSARSGVFQAAVFDEQLAPVVGAARDAPDRARARSRGLSGDAVVHDTERIVSDRERFPGLLRRRDAWVSGSRVNGECVRDESAAEEEGILCVRGPECCYGEGCAGEGCGRLEQSRAGVLDEVRSAAVRAAAVHMRGDVVGRMSMVSMHGEG